MPVMFTFTITKYFLDSSLVSTFFAWYFLRRYHYWRWIKQGEKIKKLYYAAFNSSYSWICLDRID